MSNASMAATILAALFLGFGVVDGYRKGMVKKGVSFLLSILTFVMVFFLSPYVAQVLKSVLPSGLLTDSLLGTDSEIFRMLILSGLGDLADDYLLAFIAKILSFVVTYIVVRIFTLTLFLSLRVLSAVPGLSFLNRLAGSVLGLIQHLLTLWLFFLLVSIFSHTGWGSFVYRLIMESKWLTFLYENNLLLLAGILFLLKS